MVEIFQKGGPIMWPLLFVSIVALTVVFERFIFIARDCPEKLQPATATQFPPSLLAAPRRRRRAGWIARWLGAFRRSREQAQ